MDHITFGTKRSFLSRLACPLFFAVGSSGIWGAPLFAQEVSATSACSLEGPNNCQLFDGSQNRTPSDNFFFSPAADDFVPLGSTIQSLCVWGQYVDIAFQAPDVDCSDTISADSFLVQVHESDGALPGSLIGESTATSIRSPMLAGRETQGPSTIFLFELTLDTPITGLINDGRSYWLKVGNNSDSSTFTCVWHWSQLSSSSFSGNRYAVRGSHIYAADQAFCLDIDLGANGPVLQPCCQCDGSCEVVSLADCDLVEGTWFVGADFCSAVVCPVGPPSNDDCAAGMLPIVDFSAEFNTNCATTDGYNPVDTELGLTDIDNDIWFSYVLDPEWDCQLSFDSFSFFDSVIAVYYDPNNPTVCPCPTNETEALTLVGASDEFWPGVIGGDGFVSVPGECSSDPGCYTIRIGGFEGDKGVGYVYVNCSIPGFGQPSPPVADPSGAKTRFISMSILPESPCFGPGSSQIAVRVRLATLHHVTPPYTGGPSIPFTSFEGQSRWVGPPSQYVESSSSQTPFFASTLQCNPHYRDWSTVGLLHVTGSAIVPSSMYEVENVAASCAGSEASCTAVSAPLSISTTRWGDVETPYNPPSPTTQPDVGDVSALVNKFKSAPGAPIKARALLLGSDTFGNIIPFRIVGDFDFGHIAACVDAFRGRPYPFMIQACP